MAVGCWFDRCPRDSRVRRRVAFITFLAIFLQVIATHGSGVPSPGADAADTAMDAPVRQPCHEIPAAADEHDMHDGAALDCCALGMCCVGSAATASGQSIPWDLPAPPEVHPIEYGIAVIDTPFRPPIRA